MPFRPSALKGVNSLNHTYPRFKGIGIRFFFLVVPSQEPNITCSPANIERSKSGVPFVNLPTYAQSLIDTQNTVDLEDLVDGMDLSLEWGEENLDLEGSTDTSWAQARIDALLADGTKKMFVWIDAEPHSRRAIWERMVGGKTRRLGFKYPEELYLTRFRRRGSRDPRKWNRDL
ncbi:MAG: hypothetical protein M4579_005768 [Chaenotheca gracillima]|nr:MAG: hypothetical protein M4579_005768 [Chaenotheca gracillima]